MTSLLSNVRYLLFFCIWSFHSLTFASDGIFSEEEEISILNSAELCRDMDSEKVRNLIEAESDGRQLAGYVALATNAAELWFNKGDVEAKAVLKIMLDKNILPNEFKLKTMANPALVATVFFFSFGLTPLSIEVDIEEALRYRPDEELNEIIKLRGPLPCQNFIRQDRASKE